MRTPADLSRNPSVLRGSGTDLSASWTTTAVATATQGSVEDLLARALGAPEDRGGLALALRQAIRCLNAAAELAEPRDALGEWSLAAQAVSSNLKSRASTQPALLVSTDSLCAMKGYGELVAALPGRQDDPRVARALAVLGRAIAACACAQMPVQPAIVNGVTSILRVLANLAKTDAWAELAQSCPVSLDELRAQRGGRSRGVRPFLAALELNLSMPVVSPHVLLESMRPSTVRPKQARVESTDDTVDQGVDDEQDRDGDDKRSSVIGWLIQRANRAGTRGRYSPPLDWDSQTIGELSLACSDISRVLESDTPESGFGVLAVVALASSLPARIAMKLPFAPSGDLWLAPDLSRLSWCLTQVLDHDKAVVRRDASDRRRVVDIALPACLSGAGCKRSAPLVTTPDLGTWLAGSDDEAELRRYLVRYRAWLRDLRPNWVHGLLDARFAASMSQVYRMQAGDVITALLSLDFREVALGMLHYVALPRSLLWSHCDRVYRNVGLGPASAESAWTP